MTSILFPNASPARAPKLHITTGTLQPYVDPKQAPTRRSPWRQMREAPLVKTATVTMPADLYDSIWPKITTHRQHCRYAKVFLKLEDILAGEFFSHYIKIGNILMISEGIPGVDDLYTLQDGVLRLDLGKDSYQRAGLQGTAIKNHGARKHAKERYEVMLNLRNASMVRGKKGFDRLLYAARTVLNYSKIWLFRDLSPTTPDTDPSDDKEGTETATTNNNTQQQPIVKHHPTIVEGGPQTQHLEQALIPSILMNSTATGSPLNHISPNSADHEDYYDLAEWLDLVNMRSPRVQSGDNPDGHISRYQVPFIVDDDDNGDEGKHETSTKLAARRGDRSQKLTTVRWKGLLDSQWIIEMLIDIIKQSRRLHSQHWLALSVTAHKTEALGQIEGYTIFFQPTARVSSENTTMTSLDAAKDNEKEDEDEDDHGRHGADVDEMEVEVGVEVEVEASRLQAGLQRFTCFQFVDS